MRRILICLLLLPLLGAATIHAQPDAPPLRLVSAVPILSFELPDGTTPGLGMRYATISPDASMIAWPEGNDVFCVYVFDADYECVPMPEMLRGLDSRLAWSPDSRYISIHEDFVRRFLDADVWLFDAQERTFIHRTDDDIYGGIVGHDEPVPVDHISVWHPNGDLYFIRITFDDGLADEALYRIPADELAATTEPEQLPGVLDQLSAEAPTSIFSSPFVGLDNVMAFSPDGTQLAAVVRPPNMRGPLVGVWIIDLESGAATQVMQSSDFTSGLPNITSPHQFFPMALGWTSDGGELIVAAQDQSYGQFLTDNMLYRVDLDTGEVTPVVDFSDVEDQADMFEQRDDGTTRIYDIPRASVIIRHSADDVSDVLLMLNGDVPNERGGVSAVFLPDSEVVHIGEIPNYTVIPVDNFSVGTDGQTVRALMYGYLLTLEWE